MRVEPASYFCGVLFLFALFLPGSVRAESSNSTLEANSVPVVVRDDHENLIMKMVPVTEYTQTLQAGMGAVEGSLLPVLQAHARSDSSQMDSSPAWSLQTIGVGLGLSGQIGLGPIWSATVTPRFRLIFTRSANPIYPAYN